MLPIQIGSKMEMCSLIASADNLFLERGQIMLGTMFGTPASKSIGRYFIFIGIFTLLFVSLVPIDSVSAADEYDGLRDKWKETLTGGTAYSVSDPDIAPKIIVYGYRTISGV
jgi:hypothetical protein